MKPVNLKIDKFYGGIARDDKSKIIGSAFNMEEIDIFENENYFRAEQIFSTEVAGTGIPNGITLYARAQGDQSGGGTAYGYGKDNATGKVILVSMSNGGASAPGNFTLLATSGDTTNLATPLSDLTFFRSKEATNNTYLLYIAGTGTTWVWKKYNIGLATETTLGTLSDTNGTFMRPTSRVIFGDAYICDGNFINKFDHNGTYTSAAFTLPQEWQAIDLITVGDASIILCRNRGINVNETRGYWWNTTDLVNFEDVFTLPMGGPQWIINLKEQIIMFCAVNGVGRFFRLAWAAKGAIPLQIPGLIVNNVIAETSSIPISSHKMVDFKDNRVYFGLNKTDKTGIYVLGQLDSDKPMAYLLSKRFATTDYSIHTAYSLSIQGPNFYADFKDNATDKSVRCATLNSPSRSSQAVYESLWLDGNEQLRNKTFDNIFLATYPLPAGSSVAISIAKDYSSVYTTLSQSNATNLTATNQLNSRFSNVAANDVKIIRIKISLTSNGINSPLIVAVLATGSIKEEFAVL